ncbi:DUF1836 domain-containing protein [Bacillus massiliigorillae]|uniref:DUF1836 domain-containing protein n=1 Tax=Bacillus massiliigorillae TaxID=1243664 RepID=UPI00039A2FA1|nr:DUF1836 domain-containing protein [Bacillus massiliigorillae]
MEKLHSFLEKLEREKNITLEDIPGIDLYMDQVIQMFENKYSEAKRNDDEKVLTKTMINNYAKGKLFFPIKNKKYSKEHLILISLIYQLKGALTIKDIKETLEGINKKVTEENFSMNDFYKSYLHLSEENMEKFTVDIEERMNDVKEEVMHVDDDSKEYLEKVLLISSLVNISNLYRRTAEKLVDEIVEGRE